MVGEHDRAPFAEAPPGEEEGRGGLFIVFEGVDGAGKSTQAEALRKTLQKEGRDALIIHEPGGTLLGDTVGDLLKHSRQIPISPLAEVFLFAASRAQMVAEVLRPALKRGQIVICDRFTASTEAYQGYGRGVNRQALALATEIASSGLIPDLWVLLDVDARAGLGRKRDTLGLDRFENEEEAFYTKVREGYLKIAAEDPERWLIIDGALPAGRVEKFVLEKVKILLTTGNK